MNQSHVFQVCLADHFFGGDENTQKILEFGYPHTYTYFHKCSQCYRLYSMGSWDGRRGLGGVWSGSAFGSLYDGYRGRPKSILAWEVCHHVDH